MSRRRLEIVAVDDHLVDALADLWHQARIEAGHGFDGTRRAAVDGRLVDALRRPDVRAHLAVSDGHPVGFVVTSASPFGLTGGVEIAVEQLWVAAGWRRQGVARALLESVVGLAERSGSEVVVSHVPAQSRDANRFFARLGFTATSVRRVVPTAALHRRLAPGPTETSGLRQLLAARRSQRERDGHGGRHPGTAQPAAR